MSKIAVVFWSGTGNTEAMADAVVEGIEAAGAECSKFSASDFNGGMVNDFDAIAFGCPSMGSEQLEDSEFEPMFNDCEANLKGKKIALFGSYGWGDGEWMRNWQATCEMMVQFLLQNLLSAMMLLRQIHLRLLMSLERLLHNKS